MFKAIVDRIWARTRPPLKRVVYANGGIGDELMLTALARRARELGRPLDILTNLPGLWSGNEDPASLQTDVARWHYAAMRGWIRTEIVHLMYRNGQMRHIAQQMADHLDITLEPGWRPHLVISSRPPRLAHRLVVQNSCRGARYASPTKEWSQDRWVELIGRLRSEHEIVQLGTAADPLLPGVIDLRGKTNLHQAAEQLASAALFVGLESGLMHMAAAMETPAVILYGGRSHPIETGYAFNTNLTRSPACVGCGLNDGCPHHLVCMDIPVDEVEQAIRAKLNPTFTA